MTNHSGLVQTICPSPLGELVLIASAAGLRAILWPNQKSSYVHVMSTIKMESSLILERAQQQLGEYFAQQRQQFELPLDACGTAFQQRVWRALCDIHYGETRSYTQLAQTIGNPKAARAVGAANGKNPLSIIVPCHRVIGASGKLTGCGWIG